MQRKNLEKTLSTIVEPRKKDLFGRIIDFIRKEIKKYHLIKRFKAEYSMVLESRLSKKELDFLLEEGYIYPDGPCFVPLNVHGELIQHYSPTNKGWNRFTSYKRMLCPEHHNNSY